MAAAARQTGIRPHGHSAYPTTSTSSVPRAGTTAQREHPTALGRDEVQHDRSEGASAPLGVLAGYYRVMKLFRIDRARQLDLRRSAAAGGGDAGHGCDRARGGGAGSPGGYGQCRSAGGRVRPDRAHGVGGAAQRRSGGRVPVRVRIGAGAAGPACAAAAGGVARVVVDRSARCAPRRLRPWRLRRTGTRTCSPSSRRLN